MDNEDLESALVVAQECVVNLEQDDWYCDKWRDIENYRKIFFDNKMFDTFVAKNAHVVGFIMGKGDDRIYHIRHHYVLKNYRQQGIAKMLKNHLTEYSQSLGFIEIHSAVSKKNTASIRLNRSLGWKELDDDDGFLYIKKLVI